MYSTYIHVPFTRLNKLNEVINDHCSKPEANTIMCYWYIAQKNPKVYIYPRSTAVTQTKYIYTSLNSTRYNVYVKMSHDRNRERFLTI